MPLIIRNGALLRKGSQLAASQTCCCGEPPTACNCSGTPVVVPRSVSAAITIDSLVSTSGFPSCVLADAQAFFDGTYVLPLASTDTAGAYYNETFANGLFMQLDWLCQTGTFGTHYFAYTFCDIANTCFSKIGPTSLWFTKLPFRLCFITPGSTTPFSIGNQVDFLEGPMANCGSLTPQSVFNYTATFTPTW